MFCFLKNWKPDTVLWKYRIRISEARRNIPFVKFYNLRASGWNNKCFSLIYYQL